MKETSQKTHTYKQPHKIAFENSLTCINMCAPQLLLSPLGGRACPPPPQSSPVTPPAPAPSAAHQLRPWRRAPPRGIMWLLHHRRGVSRRVRRTHQEAAGEQSPQRRRERRVRVNLHEATRTLMTVTMILFSSHRRGSEDRDRGELDKTHMNYLLD